MKVLIVEDEQRIAASIKKGLELQSFAVDVAHDGERGLDLALSEQYDVIVLDRMLPKMDGVEVCNEIRKAKVHTPILFLTARSLVSEKVEGLDSGADDYLAKPFEFSELVARVKALGRRTDSQVETTLELADLVLNVQTKEVTRDGVSISLSKKEYMLLDFLLRNKGQVFTKEQLVERVWPYDSDILPNTAQVYIGYLRKKIDKAFPQLPELIQTVSGFGYKMQAS